MFLFFKERFREVFCYLK